MIVFYLFFGSLAYWMLYNIAVCLFVFSRADPDLFQSGFNKMYLLFLFCFLFYFVMLVLLLVLVADIGCIGSWGQGSNRGCNIFVLCVAKSLCPERQCKKSLFIYFYLFNRLLILVCVCVCACFWTPFFLCVFFFYSFSLRQAHGTVLPSSYYLFAIYCSIFSVLFIFLFFVLRIYYFCLSFILLIFYLQQYMGSCLPARRLILLFYGTEKSQTQRKNMRVVFLRRSCCGQSNRRRPLWRRSTQQTHKFPWFLLCLLASRGSRYFHVAQFARFENRNSILYIVFICCLGETASCCCWLLLVGSSIYILIYSAKWNSILRCQIERNGSFIGFFYFRLWCAPQMLCDFIFFSINQKRIFSLDSCALFFCSFLWCLFILWTNWRHEKAWGYTVRVWPVHLACDMLYRDERQ